MIGHHCLSKRNFDHNATNSIPLPMPLEVPMLQLYPRTLLLKSSRLVSSCDPRKLDVQFFFYFLEFFIVLACEPYCNETESELK